MSYSYTQTEAFSVVHARHLACQVSTDLLKFNRFYKEPSLRLIDALKEELIALLNNDYLDTLMNGFIRNGDWVVAVRYRVVGGVLMADADPGKIRPEIDISGATFLSFLTRNSRWTRLTQEERDTFNASITIKRTGGNEPGVESGYWQDDLSYSAGGRGLSRSILRRW